MNHHYITAGDIVSVTIETPTEILVGGTQRVGPFLVTTVMRNGERMFDVMENAEDVIGYVTGVYDPD